MQVELTTAPHSKSVFATVFLHG